MDTLLSAIIKLLWWPYEAWKHTTESSRVGVSRDEKRTLRFWYLFALIGTLVIAVLAGAVLLALWWFQAQVFHTPAVINNQPHRFLALRLMGAA
jgi:hypothetical protein